MANCPKHPAESLDEAIALTIDNANRFNDVLNGDVNTFVTTCESGGQIPSVSKALAEAAAYKVPLAWDVGQTENDLLQPRDYAGNTYVPSTVPAVMDATPSSSLWRLFVGSLKAENVKYTGLTPTGNVKEALDSALQTVATLTELQGGSYSAGSLVDTGGRSVNGDGRGARYLIKTSAAFGGTPDGINDHTIANGNVAALQKNGTWDRTRNPLTSFNNRAEVIGDPDKTYSAFPAASMKTWIDPATSNEYLVQCYYTGDSHAGASSNPTIYSRRALIRDGASGDYIAEPVYGTRVLIVDNVPATSHPRMHGMVVNAANELLCFVNAFTPDGLTWVYSKIFKSTNGGTTWDAGTTWQASAANVVADEAGFATVLRSGRIVAFNRIGGATPTAWVVYSDDNGVTWTKTANIGLGVTAGAGKGAMEGFIIETQTDNKLVCIARQTEANSPYTTSFRAVQSNSLDGGVTWSDFFLTDLTDMTANNAALMYHADLNRYEVVYGSRHARRDGHGSMYQAWTDEANIANGVYFGQSRLALGVNAPDFGYPATAKRSDGLVYLQWYSGISNKAVLSQMQGYPDSGKHRALIDTPQYLRNKFGGLAHANYKINFYTKNQEIGFDNIARTVPPRWDIANTPQSMGGEQYLYADGAAFTAYTATPAPAGTVLLDMPTLCGSLYNRYAGGYILEIITQWRRDGVAQGELKLGNGTVSKRVVHNVLNPINTTSTAEQDLTSQELICPVYPLGHANEGKLLLTFTNEAQLRFVNIRVRGYVRRNAETA